jgi:hypothetical protein
LTANLNDCVNGGVCDGAIKFGQHNLLRPSEISKQDGSFARDHHLTSFAYEGLKEIKGGARGSALLIDVREGPNVSIMLV